MGWCWLPSTLEIKFNGKKGVVGLGCVVFEDGGLLRTWSATRGRLRSKSTSRGEVILTLRLAR